jgi:hypothetical protein
VLHDVHRRLQRRSLRSKFRTVSRYLHMWATRSSAYRKVFDDNYTSSPLIAFFQQATVHKPLLIISRWYSVIAACYGLDGSGFESRWGGEILHTRPDRQVCSLPVNRPGRDDCPPPPGAEVTERVQLYHCSPSGALWPVLGRPLPFTRSQTDGQSSRKVLRLYFVSNV